MPEGYKSARFRQCFGQPLRVVAPEDFVVLKILATRDRDLEDARIVFRSLAGRIDVELIEHLLNELSADIVDYDFMARWLALESQFE